MLTATRQRSSYLADIDSALWARGSLSFRPDKDVAISTERAARVAGPRVIFAGFPSEFSLAFLLALTSLQVDVVALLTSPGAHPAVRAPNALSRIADHLDVPLVRAWDVNGDDTCRTVADLAPDAVVMASFDQIVRPAMLAIPRHGWLNVHPSALPSYRGPEPIYWAVAEGARTSGVTLHRVVPRLDAGPILAQEIFPLDGTEDAGSLTFRCAQAGTRLLPAALDALLAGEAGRIPDLASGSYRTSIGAVDLATATSVVQAERWVRAGHPENPPRARIGGRKRHVLRARVADRSSRGHVLRYPDGALEIVQVAETSEPSV